MISNGLLGLSKILEYPKVIPDIYRITKEGIIYSIINEDCISWSVRNKMPYVNLSCKDVLNDNIYLEPFYIKDLVAYNFLPNAKSYIERGFRSVNIDGDPMNCNYSNIIFIDDSVLD